MEATSESRGGTLSPVLSISGAVGRLVCASFSVSVVSNIRAIPAFRNHLDAKTIILAELKRTYLMRLDAREDTMMSITFFTLNDNGELEPFEIEKDLVGELKLLREDHSLYFNLDVEHEIIPLCDLVNTRARSKGIRNANSLMAAAAEGTQAKRDPITISRWNDALWRVEDGNSTLVNARISEWTNIPCRKSPSKA